MSAAHVVLVDDHQLLAESLRLALVVEGLEATTLAPTSPQDVLDGVEAAAPDLVLLDLDLGPGVGDGSLLVTPLVAAGRRVLVVSASTDVEQVARALESGAVGVVRKDVAFDVLLDGVLAAARGEEVTTPAAREALLARARALRGERTRAWAPFAELSRREAEVLRALARGTGVASLAADWHVSEATVRSQVRAILTKLGVSSQLEAVARAHESGWLADARG